MTQRSATLRPHVLHHLDLDFLDLGQAVPLLGQDMIDLLMQMADFEFGLEVDAIIVFRTKPVLRLKPLLTSSALTMLRRAFG